MNRTRVAVPSDERPPAGTRGAGGVPGTGAGTAPASREVRPGATDLSAGPTKDRDRVRVCMLLTSFHPVIGGTQRVTLRLCRELIERDIDVVVLTRRYPGLSRFERVRGVPVHRVGLPSRTKLGALSYALDALWSLAWRLREYRILHAHSPDTPLLVGLVAKLLLGRRLFATVRSTPALVLGSERRTGPWRLRMLDRWADGVGALSPAIRDQLVEQGVSESRIVSLPNGVDTDRFRPPAPDQRRRARETLVIGPDTIAYLFVGRLVALKAVDVLLRAWARACARPDRVLLIVGDGEEAPRLEALARELELSNVRFEGSADDVLPFLHAADVFVLPSRVEGLSNALLEAMAAGLPPIVSGLPANLALVRDGENGLSFPVDDVASLARCLSALQAEERRRGLGAEALRTVRAEFSLASAVERHRRLYAEAEAGAPEQTKPLPCSTAGGKKEKRPRVLFVSYTADRTGPTHSLASLLRHLGDDFEPWVLLPGHGPFSDALEELAVPVLSLPSLTKWSIPRIVGLLRRHGIDLVYGNNTSGCCRNAMVAAKLARVPFVCHVREMGAPGGWKQFGFLRFSDAVVAVSEACARSVLPYAPNECLHVVHNGVEPAARAGDGGARGAAVPDVPAGAFVVLSVAHILPRKGQHLAVEAMARLEDRVPSAHLFLAGALDRDPGYVADLRDRIAAVGLAHRIHLLGFQEEIGPLLEMADVFLHTALRDPHPRAVLEAMAAGLPVVAFDADGVGETVLHGSTGILCRPGNVEEVVEALGRCWEDSELRAALGAGGRQRVEQHFTAARAARRVQEILHRILAPWRQDTRPGQPILRSRKEDRRAKSSPDHADPAGI